MTTTNHLNLLLSDILQSTPVSTKEMYRGSFNPTSSLLAFANEESHPSITALTPLPPLARRSTSLLKHRRQRQCIPHSDKPNQQATTTTTTDVVQPLLNSSTLDDLFRALTLECEQYLSAPSYQNKIYDSLIIEPSKLVPNNMDSNDDDYENLHPARFPLLNGLSPLRTSIEVVSPEKRQVVSISVSSKKSPSPIVSSSRTFPLLSTTYTSTTMIPHSNHCYSSDDDSIDISSSSTTHRRRRRRIRKQPIISSIPRSSSSEDDRSEAINGSIHEKKSHLSKRSSSTDPRQQRVHTVYDNYLLTTGSGQKYPPSRRTRRRDISLQQQQHYPSILTRPFEDISPRFTEKSRSPLSILLTSTGSASDFLDHPRENNSQVQRIDSRPLSLLDRMHQQFYRTSSTGHRNNIPTHRIPSYPVY